MNVYVIRRTRLTTYFPATEALTDLLSRASVDERLSLTHILSPNTNSAYPANRLTMELGLVGGHCRRAFKNDQLCALNFDQGR